MRKYQWLISVVLIGCMISFTSCQRIQKILDPTLSETEPEVSETEPEVVEPVMRDAQMGDASMLTNSLIIAEARVVNTPLPEPSNSPTAPQVEGNLPEVTASVGSLILLPFEYSGTNPLAGCIVYIPGVGAYYEIPYTGGPDDLPSAIPVSLPENVGVGTFIEVCYGVYDNQGQTSNFLNTVIRVGEAVPTTEPSTGPVDVLIYTGSTWWLTAADATIEAETTRSLLQAAGIQVEITESEETVREWMLQTTANGSVNVFVSYGVIPNAVYPTGNTQPDGSIVENWMETSDGDAILNQSDWLGYSSSSLEGRALHGSLEHGANGSGALENLMDIPNISLFNGGPMVVTADGMALAPSLVDFNSERPFPLAKLEGGWFAEKIFASDTSGTRADPVVLRDGDRGRLVIVQQTHAVDKPKGEVAAEIIINFLL